MDKLGSVLELEVELDALERWRAGVQKYGLEWVGGPPLEEGYQEALDGINYADEHNDQYGTSPEVLEIRGLFVLVGVKILQLLKAREN